MYFRLTTDVANMSQYWEQSNNAHVRLGRGRPLNITEDAIQIPFEFSVSYHPGIDGNPKVQPLYDYVSNTKVMHKRLSAALQTAGVDNLQTFPAVVVDGVSAAQSHEYLVVNVIGLVSCADSENSIAHPIGNAYYFDKLVIDPAKTNDLLLFRLKESPIEIVIHEKVADAISRGGFTGVVLEPASVSPPRP